MKVPSEVAVYMKLFKDLLKPHGMVGYPVISVYYSGFMPCCLLGPGLPSKSASNASVSLCWPVLQVCKINPKSMTDLSCLAMAFFGQFACCIMEMDWVAACSHTDM